jgi:hypothetical protein
MTEVHAKEYMEAGPKSPTRCLIHSDHLDGSLAGPFNPLTL